MSIYNDACDICGSNACLVRGEKVKSSSSTGKMWCGKCNRSKESQIMSWLFNKEATFTSVDDRKDNPATPIKRPSWDEYYLNIAKAVSARGDCARRQHGAVVVKAHKILSTGYNGTPPGDNRSCGATGQCPRNLDANAQHSKGEYDLCWATHAEANALLRANWEELQGATIYITGSPCPGCAKLIASAGIAKTVSLSTEGVK